jgi:hypothetical protein
MGRCRYTCYFINKIEKLFCSEQPARKIEVEARGQINKKREEGLAEERKAFKKDYCKLIKITWCELKSYIYLR